MKLTAHVAQHHKLSRNAGQHLPCPHVSNCHGQDKSPFYRDVPPIAPGLTDAFPNILATICQKPCCPGSGGRIVVASMSFSAGNPRCDHLTPAASFLMVTNRGCGWGESWNQNNSKYTAGKRHAACGITSISKTYASTL